MKVPFNYEVKDIKMGNDGTATLTVKILVDIPSREDISKDNKAKTAIIAERMTAYDAPIQAAFKPSDFFRLYPQYYLMSLTEFDSALSGWLNGIYMDYKAVKDNPQAHGIMAEYRRNGYRLREAIESVNKEGENGR